MRITIVCGHFIPAMGYIEVHLARAFAEMGHQVTVVTSDAIPPYVKHLHNDFGQPPEGVEVKRLKPIFTLGQVVVSKGVKRAVLNSNPDQIIIIGLGKRFPKPGLGLGVHTTVLFGDNAASYGDSSSIKTKVLFDIFKRSTYRKAIEKADRLVAYTPESFEAAAKMLGGRWAKKLREQNDFISLGFHPSEFYFDPKLREAKRRELSYSDSDQVIITATRIRPEKNLEAAIPAFAKADEKVKWLLLGSAGDVYSDRFEAKLISELGAGRFIILPHQNRVDLNAFYNAADVGLFTAPAISIIEAMGAGLPVILPNDRSLAHLISHFNHGQFFDDLSKIELGRWTFGKQKLSEAGSRQFTWEKIAKELI